MDRQGAVVDDDAVAEDDAELHGVGLPNIRVAVRVPLQDDSAAFVSAARAGVWAPQSDKRPTNRSIEPAFDRLSVRVGCGVAARLGSGGSPAAKGRPGGAVSHFLLGQGHSLPAASDAPSHGSAFQIITPLGGQR
jgi:hypothetical protein